MHNSIKNSSIWKDVDYIIAEALIEFQKKHDYKKKSNKKKLNKLKKDLFDKIIYPEIEETVLCEFEDALHDITEDIDLDDDIENQDFLYERYCEAFDKIYTDN